MKKLIIILSFLLSFSSFASISIISDLDDTIKITEAGGDLTDIIGDDLYTGMFEFFKEAKSYSNSLYIVSASPYFMERLIRKTLKTKGIDYKSLTLRTNLAEDKFSYKVRKIKEIIENSSDDFILIGDDIGKDPEAFSAILKLFPGRVLKSYIHVVKNRSLSKDSVLYWTSFDLMLRENIEGRMSAESVESGFQAIWAEKLIENIFPQKAHCPASTDYYNWQFETPFQYQASRLMDKLVWFCQLRQSSNNLP